ncbi:MAG: hypothetical protein AAF762_11500, partial [Pseudomonadota bacterium]
MNEAFINSAHVVAALLTVLLALTVTPAKFAARGALRQVTSVATAKAKAPALLLGLGMGGFAAILLFGTLLHPPGALTVALLLVLALLAVMDVAWRWLPLEWVGLIAALGTITAVLQGDIQPAGLGALVGG